ncbi:MAG: hypothetical protein HYR85_21625 [Planctomycetes bacterium]|nr:hypothetical protein [Planctomycetota bacterium]MBI3845886.1 hypothetical protein [Planctomycetota bacterium]
MISHAEKRRHHRIDLTVPVQLAAIDDRESSQRSSDSPLKSRIVVGNAVSLNVCARGIYLRTFSSHTLTPGDRYDVCITVPESVLRGSTTSDPMRPLGVECLNAVLQGTGRIVRVERLVSFDVVGIGAALEFDRPLEFGGVL